MNAFILDYLVKQKNLTPVVAKIVGGSLSKYADIENEFISCIKNGTYDLPNAIAVDGYTATKIHELAPFMDQSGVYGFLVTLRDDPVKAHQYIEQGFPRK